MAAKTMYRPVTAKRLFAVNGLPVTLAFYATLKTTATFPAADVQRVYDLCAGFANKMIAPPTDLDACASQLYDVVVKFAPSSFIEAGIDDGVDQHVVRVE